MISERTISKSQGADFEPLPADVYQVQIIDVDEREGVKYGTQDEKVMQFMFKTQVVEGEQKGKGLVVFTSESWFDGGKNSKPSKLFNLIRTIYSFYKDKKIADMQVITDKDINGLVGKQIRLTVETTDAGKNKVAGFLPIKEEIEYEAKVTEPEAAVDIDSIPF